MPVATSSENLDLHRLCELLPTPKFNVQRSTSNLDHDCGGTSMVTPIHKRRALAGDDPQCRNTRSQEGPTTLYMSLHKVNLLISYHGRDCNCLDYFRAEHHWWKCVYSSLAFVGRKAPIPTKW
ncbi:hypothetical protein PISMIDRAFT_128508 [Pisolithus microcarpus 441]|uniref:Uncharacterized protein n=1 Tax=Pisolithus microcarpus 441 TaxID=765257 RepID=A0A0D0A9Q4_9AGAM|nr:hypothetical protein PISMIDRAFT_128508 [Pisolithus microcarpus 441]